MAKAAPNATSNFILSELNESDKDLRAKGLSADTLAAIYNDYLARLSELAEIAEQLTRTLQKAEGVHTLKHRLKDPLHLLQKIIRKKKEYPGRDLHTGNYLDYINDLIGVRILHLYKADWKTIGDYIEQVWPLKRKAYAYINQHDTAEHIQLFKSCNCKILEHPTGYRAVHFVIATQPNKQRYYAEIQLRTLFEEAWSEIDHHVRYPNHEHSALLDDLLRLLNIFTSNADETATQIQALANELNNPSTQKEKVKSQFRAHISKLPIPEPDKQQLYSKIDQML